MKIDWWLVLTLCIAALVTVGIARLMPKHVTPCPQELVRYQPVIIGKLITQVPVYRCKKPKPRDTTRVER